LKKSWSFGTGGFRRANKQDKKKTPRHNIIKTLHIQKQERILKDARENFQVIYKVKPIRTTADYSTETKSKKGKE
jgi:hypothetical protein